MKTNSTEIERLKFVSEPDMAVAYVVTNGIVTRIYEANKCTLKGSLKSAIASLEARGFDVIPDGF